MFESMDFASLLPTREATIERRAVVDANNNSSSITIEDDYCSMLPSLTWTERLIGCGTCMVAGYLLSFGAFFRIKHLVLGNPRTCAVHSFLRNLGFGGGDTAS